MTARTRIRRMVLVTLAAAALSAGSASLAAPAHADAVRLSGTACRVNGVVGAAQHPGRVQVAPQGCPQ